MDWEAEFTRKLSSAANGEKNAVVATYMQLTGKSAATLYRVAAEHGWKSGRKPRADRGKSALGAEQAQTLSCLLQVTARQNKGPIMPVTRALEIAQDSGIIARGIIGANRAATLLREHAMGAKALREATPHIRLASRHPNHVHVFDGSVCVQYFLRGGGVAVMDERDFNEKKPKNCARIGPRILRMMLVDHFSHYMFVKYYAADGEDQAIIFDFLYTAWTGGLHEKLPFRGVPQYVLMDAGSANISKAMRHMLHELGIKMPKNLPHNPRRQGSAECAHNIWETHFESGMRLAPAASDIAVLNTLALDYLVRWNTVQKHRRHGMSRMACWMKFIQGHLVDCPSREQMQEAFAKEPEVRTVRGDYTITFENREFVAKHIQGVRPGLKVLAKKRPMLWPQLVVIFGGEEYVVEPIAKMEGGFRADAQVIGEGYKAQPETAVQKARKANEALAFGPEKEKDAVPFCGALKVFGHHAETVPAVPMPVRGAPMEVTHDLGERRIPIMELLKRLRGAGVSITTDLNAELRDALGDSVAAGAADEIIRAIADGRDWRVTDKIHAVAGGV